MLRHERHALLRAHERDDRGVHDVERASGVARAEREASSADALVGRGHGVDAAVGANGERDDETRERDARRCDGTRSLRYAVRVTALAAVLALAIGAAAGAWWGGGVGGDARARAATGVMASVDGDGGLSRGVPMLDHVNGDFVGARGKRREAVGLGRSARGSDAAKPA